MNQFYKSAKHSIVAEAIMNHTYSERYKKRKLLYDLLFPDI
jgi:hypothetical protein